MGRALVSWLTILLAVLLSTAAVSQGPQGVRLRWYDVIDDSPVSEDRQFVAWGALGEEIEAQLGKDSYIRDWSGEKAWVLGVPKYGGWWADFADDAPRAYTTTLYFQDGKFFRYFVTVEPQRFGHVHEALEKALGMPSSKETSEVQNRMGATFDQEILFWEFEDVSVVLMKRADVVTEGLLSVTFKPLAATPSEDAAEAPF